MKWFKMSVSVLLITLLLFTSYSAPLSYAEQNVPEIQLIADQVTATPGGTVSYHLIYHQVDNKNKSKAWLKIKVPDGMEMVKIDGSSLELIDGILRWDVTDIPKNGAQVVHFQLKVKQNEPRGKRFEIICEKEVDGVVVIRSPKISVKTETEVHQPVFYGYPDGTFRPASNLTRAEMAAILTGVLKLTDLTVNNPYSDVSKSHWAYSYIQRVTKAGYMKGDSGLFRPDDPITKAEFVTLLLRIKGIQPVPLHGFYDTDHHWAKDQIGTAKALKYITGDDHSLFAPDRYIDRASASMLLGVSLYRGQLTDGETKVVQHFPDVKRDHWAFGWVEELSLVAHESENWGAMKEKLIRYLPEQTEHF